MQQREVGSFEAKTHFAQLLAQVIKEDDGIIITRHGKRVAVLTPYKESNTVNAVAETLATIRNLRKGLKLNPPGIKVKLTLKELIDEGRR